MSAVASPGTVSQDAHPLRLGGANDFARVASLLTNARFDEATIARTLDITSLADLGSVRRDQADLSHAPSAAHELLVRLFLLLQPTGRAEAEHTIDERTLGSLQALDLLRVGRTLEGADVYYASVLLYPVAGLLIASDRHHNADGSPFVVPPDVVFPAIFAGTLRFLRVIPKSPVRDALDLCSGTGIGAFVLSGHAERVVAADLTARSTHFARFNRLLNGCANVEIVQGDLYEPVAGRTFDRIVAHPPYVPALSQSQVFRDAGEAGESVLEQIVAGLPDHLRSGGTFVSVSAGWDTTEGPFEERIRRWLGDYAGEFDVILAEEQEMSPAQVARWLSDKAAGGDPEVRERFEERFTSAALERNVYGAIVVHRGDPAGSGGKPVTVRLRMSELTDGPALEWALRWQRWRSAKQAAGELEQALLGATLCLGAGLQVKTLHVVEDGRLVQAGTVLESEKPLLAATKIEPWMLSVVAEFTGGRSAGEVHERARQSGALPEGFGTGDFAAMVGAMIERGYLNIDGEIIGDTQRALQP